MLRFGKSVYQTSHGSAIHSSEEFLFNKKGGKGNLVALYALFPNISSSEFNRATISIIQETKSWKRWE